jgi:hypothetical protein
VPSSTFTPGVFPLTVIGICFQILPFMPFCTTSTGCLLTDPLREDSLCGKPNSELLWSKLHSLIYKASRALYILHRPVTPSVVMGSHGLNTIASLTLLPECTFMSLRYLRINSGKSWTSRFYSSLMDRFWFYNQLLTITAFGTYHLSPLRSK